MNTATKSEPAGIANADSTWRRVMVPVDFSAGNARVVKYAAGLAGRIGASLTLVHVVQPFVRTATKPHAGNSEDRRDARAKLRLGVLGRRMLRYCRVVETSVRSGITFFEINEAAKVLKADLIIMGTRPYDMTCITETNGTTERILRHAPCPVLIVHEREA